MDLQKAIQHLAKKYDVTEKQIRTDITYLQMCFIFAQQSTAKRLKVGEFILTRHGTIVPGYNGTAPGTSNECEYVDEHTGQLVTHPYVICGLQNGIYKAAKEGIALAGGVGYSTDSPCPKCVSAVLSVGIKRFVYCRPYRLTEHLSNLTDAGIPVCHIPHSIVFPKIEVKENKMTTEHEEIITPNMVINLESELNSVIEEDAFIKHFHISKEVKKSVAHILTPYDETRFKGATILLKELNGGYSYQFAYLKPEVKRSYSRQIGRYWAYKKALLKGFTPLLSSNLPQDEGEREVFLLDHIVTDILGSLPQYQPAMKVGDVRDDKILLPDLSEPIPLTDLNDNFLSTFEELLKQVVGISTAELEYTVNGDETSLSVKVDKDSLEDPDELSNFEWLATEGKLQASVKLAEGDTDNEYVAKYYVINKLFNKITALDV